MTKDQHLVEVGMNQNFYRIQPSHLNPVYVEILLDKNLIALIDIEDLEIALRRRWYACPKGLPAKGLFYAASRANRKAIYLHRLLLTPPKGKCVDHINRNSLDNRRSNLRICTPAENARNHGNIAKSDSTSGVRGVYTLRRSGKLFYVASASTEANYGTTKRAYKTKRFSHTNQGLMDAELAVCRFRQELGIEL